MPLPPGPTRDVSMYHPPGHLPFFAFCLEGRSSLDQIRFKDLSQHQNDTDKRLLYLIHIEFVYPVPGYERARERRGRLNIQLPCSPRIALDQGNATTAITEERPRRRPFGGPRYGLVQAQSPVDILIIIIILVI
jgi:hypothetical protein